MLWCWLISWPDNLCRYLPSSSRYQPSCSMLPYTLSYFSSTYIFFLNFLASSIFEAKHSQLLTEQGTIYIYFLYSFFINRNFFLTYSSFLNCAFFHAVYAICVAKNSSEFNLICSDNVNNRLLSGRQIYQRIYIYLKLVL